MIKAIAIDDEPIALDIIRRYSERVPYINLEKQFLNGLEARDYLMENDVQLLFLDVRMPDINGIDLFKGLEEKPLVIFSTAYSEYALSGFELEALDYLLKPYSFERFEKACLRAKEMLELKGIIENNPTLFVKDGYQMVKIDLKEISVLQAVGNYLRFVMNGREVLARMTIKEFLSEWADNNFIQVHRSYVINMDKVSRLDRHVIWIDDIEIPIGGSFQDLVKEKFKL
ncbi:LytR/AlgR family response regulator transcription factor [Sphingobacterium daejeonense]|uniref:LytR/AlgR family response regulator transcription factor n=1 Tax=Sphingobacterium daejeonense TaxID=371142 RepID=A0ABW3RJX2_9SPHI